jgi:hypothetical protein
MPDLNIEVAGYCPQHNAEFSVPGSGGKTWSVTFDMDGRRCDCPAFQYYKCQAEDESDRTCKHVALVAAHGCLYDPQGGDLGPNDLSDQGIKIVAHDGGYGEPCPGCGDDMMPVRIAV